MSFIDGDGGERKWVTDRDTTSLQDPVRLAAEQLADAVETYLYAQGSGVWMKPEYLAWAVHKYDVQKTGSGNYVQQHQEFDPEVELAVPYADKSVYRVKNPELEKNIAVRFSEDAREGLARLHGAGPDADHFWSQKDGDA